MADADAAMARMSAQVLEETIVKGYGCNLATEACMKLIMILLSNESCVCWRGWLDCGDLEFGMFHRVWIFHRFCTDSYDLRPLA